MKNVFETIINRKMQNLLRDEESKLYIYLSLILLIGLKTLYRLVLVLSIFMLLLRANFDHSFR